MKVVLLNLLLLIFVMEPLLPLPLMANTSVSSCSRFLKTAMQHAPIAVGLFCLECSDELYQSYEECGNFLSKYCFL